MIKACGFQEENRLPRVPHRSLMLVSIALLLLAPHAPAQAAETVAPAPVDPAISITGARLAARVGDGEILLADLDLSVNQYVMAYRLSPDSHVTVLDIQRLVLDRMITVHLASQHARERGVAATEEEVDERINTVRAELGSPADFRLYLTVQNMTEGKLREQMGRQISAEKLLQKEVIDLVSVTESEIKSYYKKNREKLMGPERVKARHIFVRLRPEMTEEERDAVRKKIDDARARLDAGEKFADLAVAVSEDPAAASGGDLGWIARGTVSGPFEVVLFSLPKTEISAVVPTDYGYHIIQVLEKQEAAVQSLEDARTDIEYELLEEKRRVEVQRYLAGLRADTEVWTFLPGDDAGS